MVSGPTVIGNELQRISHVLVSTHIQKMVYSLKQRAAAYVIANGKTRACSTVTVSKLEKMVGIQLLSGLAQMVRNVGMDLPQPSAQRG